MRKREQPAEDKLQVQLDTQAFQVLSANVKAQEEANRIAQQTLTTAKLNARLYTEVLERYAHLGEQVSDIIAEMRDFINQGKELQKAVQTLELAIKAHSEIVREFIDEVTSRLEAHERGLSNRLGRLEEIELVRLAGITVPQTKSEDWKTQLTRERMQRELQQHYINLNELRETAAKYGMSAPLDVRNSIRYEEEAIAELEAELGSGKSSTVSGV